MSTAVADRSSNKNEQIVHAAEVIGRSEHRRKVFKAIYTGKANPKSAVTLMTATGLGRTRVLDAGKALADNDLVLQKKKDGVWFCAYALDLYGWVHLGDVDRFGRRGCVGNYIRADDTAPSAGTKGARHPDDYKPDHELDPFPPD